MTFTEQPVTRTVELDTDVLNITEVFEPHYRLIVSSTKRSETFQVVRVSGRFIFYKILYETGKGIPSLEGNYTSAKEALDALKRFLYHTKVTKQKVYKDRWGDKPIPELKRKK